MKKILVALFVTLALVNCSSKHEENKNVEAKLEVGKSLASLQLSDQNEKIQTLPEGTKIVFFSFSKKMGHECNEFLGKKPSDFLKNNNAVYVADVSAAPSLIRSMFIMPDLKELEFPILIITDEDVSSEYTKGMDKESIVAVLLEDGKITDIKNLSDISALEKLFAH